MIKKNNDPARRFGGEAKIDATVDLTAAVRVRAENLFLTKQYLCTEAVFVVLNETLRGGLTESQAVGLAAGFPLGLGESGCLCGALSGGVLALGHFLGGAHPLGRRGEIRAASNLLHRQWIERHKSTCCRVLTKNVQADPKSHFTQCAGFTGEAAELTMRIILDKRPELAARVDADFLARRGNFFSARRKRLTEFIKSLIRR
ncbi:MAG: C-GCAxxG-C-C family protein [Pseudomonadota bacterium]